MTRKSLAAFKKVCRKARPGTGDSEEYLKDLSSAKDSWDDAKAASRVGRPSQGGSRGPVSRSPVKAENFTSEICTSHPSVSQPWPNSKFNFASFARSPTTLEHNAHILFGYFARMPVSAPQRAKRTLVQLPQTLAQQYNLVLRVTLDASDAQVLGCFQKGLPQGSPRHG